MTLKDLSFNQRLPVFLAALCPPVLAFAPRGMSVLLAVFTLLLIAFAVGARQSLPPIKYKSLTLSTLALALIGASAMWSDSPRAYEMLRDTAYVSISVFLLYQLSRGWSDETIRLTHKALTAFFISFLLLFTINLLAGFPLQELVNGPALKGEPFIETNIPKRSAALFVLFMWPVAFGFWMMQQRRMAYGVLALTAVLSLLFNSTTAMIGSFGGIAVLLLGHWRLRAAQTVGLAALPLGFVLMIVLALSLPNLPDKITNHLKDTGDYRLMIWNFVARQSIENLPFGIGIDGSRVLPSYGESVPYKKGDILPDHPHNIYLQTWLELGIPGVILAMLLTGLLWRRVYYAPRAIQPFLWGYVTSAAITLAIAYGMWQAWWLAGHGLAAVYLAAMARTYKEA